MRPLVVLAVFALAQGAASAQALRCESADGKVSYAQNDCPPGTQPVRAVPPPGQIAREEQRAAAARARGDAKALERIERARQAEESRLEKAQQADRLRAQARARTCKRLELRVRQAREDAAAAAPLNRAHDAKRRLKKAQENYELECSASQ